MKKLTLFLCSIFLSLSLFTSCGMATDSVEIESVRAVLDKETGVTTVTIKYLDDIEPPLIFELPAGAQGMQGLEGVGIEKIEEKLDDNNERIGITIYYTDKEKEPTFISFTDGKDGISIKDVQSEMQDDGSIKLTFIDAKGEVVGEGVTIPAGTKITNIESIPQDDGSIEVKVYYTGSEDPHKFKIDAVRGVKEISSSIENDKYVITFDYTDGTNSSISFDRPNTWLSGYGRPDHELLGIDGDFYFDLSSKLIYQKFNGKWGNGNGDEYVPVANLKPDGVPYTITFILEEDYEGYTGKMTEYTFLAGASFAGEKISVPEVSKDGYEFLGWYTIPNMEKVTVNHSRFTDLTPISGNLTLYAHWEKISD